MTQDKDITLAMILQHMQGMEHRLRQEFRTGLEDFKTETRQNFSIVNAKIDRHYAILTQQIDGLDARLDDVENVQIPMLKKAVGIH